MDEDTLKREAMAEEVMRCAESIWKALYRTPVDIQEIENEVNSMEDSLRYIRKYLIRRYLYGRI